VLKPGAELLAHGTDWWAFRADAPAGVDAVSAALMAAHLLAARAERQDCRL